METSYAKELLMSAVSTYLQGAFQIITLLEDRSRIDAVLVLNRNPNKAHLILCVEILYRSDPAAENVGFHFRFSGKHLIHPDCSFVFSGTEFPELDESFRQFRIRIADALRSLIGLEPQIGRAAELKSKVP